MPGLVIDADFAMKDKDCLALLRCWKNRSIIISERSLQNILRRDKYLRFKYVRGSVYQYR